MFKLVVVILVWSVVTPSVAKEDASRFIFSDLLSDFKRIDKFVVSNNSSRALTLIEDLIDGTNKRRDYFLKRKKAEIYIKFGAFPVANKILDGLTEYGKYYDCTDFYMFRADTEMILKKIELAKVFLEKGLRQCNDVKAIKGKLKNIYFKKAISLLAEEDLAAAETVQTQLAPFLNKSKIEYKKIYNVKKLLRIFIRSATQNNYLTFLMLFEKKNLAFYSKYYQSIYSYIKGRHIEFKQIEMKELGDNLGVKGYIMVDNAKLTINIMIEASKNGLKILSISMAE